MRYPLRLLPGWIGALFVGACCVGAGPLLASAAVAGGAGFLAGIFNIYVLGPLAVVSVAWLLWSTYRRARGLGRTPARYAPLWVATAGSAPLFAGVFLLPFVAGIRPVATVLIYAGLAVMLAGTVWSVLPSRRRPRVGPPAGVVE